MKGLELLEKYPEVAVIIRQFYTDQLLESLKGGDFPEEFKDFARAQPLDNEYIAEFINTAPRGLFDVFDVNEIYIGITPIYKTEDISYKYTVGTEINGEESTRKDAESKAVELAFEILNKKICQIV